MRLFALVLSDGPLAIDLFVSSCEVEPAFVQVVREGPGFRELLETRELAADSATDRGDPCSLN